MGTLRDDHLYLYRRVRLKAIVHIALGLVLLLLPSTVPQSESGHVTQLVQSALSIFGFVYLLIGVGIAVGLKINDSQHRALRFMMTIAAIYSTLWSLLLVAIILDKPNRSTAYISVIYWYLTYNLWYVRNDPGWRAIEIVKEMKDDERSNTSTTK